MGSKREFTKAKQFRKKHKEDGFHRVSALHKQQTSAFMLAGMDVNEVSEATLRRYVKDTDHKQNFLKRKKEEIADRDIHITSFGEDTQIECDEMALMMNAMDLAKVWVKLMKKKKNCTAITKQTEI